MARTKLVKSAGRFGVRYGARVKRKTAAVEMNQRKKQFCIFCKGRAKRLSKGIWLCKKCKRKFASHAYYLDASSFKEKSPETREAKPLKKSKSKKKEE